MTERRRVQQWHERQGYVADAADEKWEFSMLWYLIREKVEEIKQAERKGLFDGDDGAGLGGDINGGYGGRGMDTSGEAVESGGENGARRQMEISEVDRAWLLFEDE